uniref:uncharacterized protein LOC101299075 isoform X5 n=1 Tax=Fragaria vesca subsp. vesca TaxID=101020 RepID=UPI0005C972E6|nr:PREDICTED: uncharacterized protein LOC101299075 isoform X5 [Fragaria vesca subsp. vesca]
MASKGSCFFCKAESDVFVDGWKLKDGSSAQLCRKCGFAYVNGIFCETFHMGAEGWRDCAVCGKPLHCGCIMSCHKYAALDVGGVGCSNCLLDVDKAIASGQMTQMLKELVAKYKTDPTVTFDPTRKVVESLSPGSVQVPSPQFGASKGDTSSETKVDSETPQMDASTGNHLHTDNWLKTTSAEQLPKVSGNLISCHISLFEKSSTASVANCSTGCLVILKKYAEKQTPRDIQTGPTPKDTSLKADQEQSPMDMETNSMPMETNQKTNQKRNQEQSPRDIETGPTAVGKSLKADQKQTPRDVQTGPMPVNSSMKTEKTPRNIQTGPMPVNSSMKRDKKQTPRDIQTGPTPKDTSLKADQKQIPRDVQTGPMPVNSSMKTDKEQTRDIQTDSMPVNSSLKTGKKQSPRNLKTSPIPVQTSQKSEQGQSPRDMETGPTPVGTSVKTDQEESQREMETGPSPDERTLKTDQEQSTKDMETSLKTD